MGKEKNPGYGQRIKQYFRTKRDAGLPSHANVLYVFMGTQKNNLKNEMKRDQPYTLRSWVQTHLKRDPCII